MKHSFKLLLLAATTIVLGLPAIASAAVAASSTQFFSGYTKGTLTLNVPIGQLTSCTIGLNGTANNCLGLYIQAWYGFTLGVVGILATIMMMFAGFKYLTSRGNGKAIGEAKDLMVSGISGVVIAFLSYTILSLISPQLLIIHIPAIPTIKDNSGIDISAQKAAALGYSDLPSSKTGSNPTNVSGLSGSNLTAKQPNETAAQALSRNAAAARGQGIGNSPDTAYGAVGCALAVDRLVHATYGLPDNGYNLGVPGLYSELTGSGNFQEVAVTSANQLKPGDIVMSIDAPKPDGGTRSHTGVVQANGNIISNSSGNRTFSWETDYSGWISYYPNSNNNFHVLRPK